MNYLQRANELKEETIQNRRYIHQNAEVGLDLPKTKAYVMAKLKEYGIEAKDCGYGVTATIGNGGKTILLRADMDALKIQEQADVEYKSKIDGMMHACGHDGHAAIGLTVAKLLSQNNITDATQLEATSASGAIAEIKTAVINGNTRYYGIFAAGGF